MRKRILIGAVCIAASSVLLTGCPGPLTDDTNYNFIKEGIEIEDRTTGLVKTVNISNDENNTAEIFYDITPGMKEIASNSTAREIIQDSLDIIDYSIEKKFYTVDINGIEEHESVSAINNIEDIEYGGDCNDVLVQAIESELSNSGDKKVIPKLKIIITDFSTQIDNYQDVVSSISNNLFNNDLSMAILSVKLPKPLFIFVSGYLKDVSDYITAFYRADNVIKYNGYVDWSMLDNEHNVNCKLYFRNCGIKEINYANIRAVEKGTFRNEGNNFGSDPSQEAGQNPPPVPGNEMGQNPPPIPGNEMGQNPPPAQEPGQRPGQPGQAPAGNNTQGAPMDDPNVRYDENGSFSILRVDHGPEQLKYDIDGTVNFQEEKSGIVTIVNPKGVGEKDYSKNKDNIKYLSFRSLLWEEDPRVSDETSPISGKAKLQIPFDIIEQIQLTDLDYKLTTEYYDTADSKRRFYPSEIDLKNNIEVAYADYDGPMSSQKFRIDNVDKTAVVNIYVNNLHNIPYATKLDIKFTVTDPGKVPAWVEVWSKMPEYRNLKRFIDQLNKVNMTDNKFEDQVTVYILAGSKESYQQATFQPLFSNEEEYTPENNSAAE